MKSGLFRVGLVALGIALGYALGTHSPIVAQSPPAEQDRQDEQIVEQLKQVNPQLKSIGAMFRDGTARVIPVINPDKP